MSTRLLTPFGVLVSAALAAAPIGYAADRQSLKVGDATRTYVVRTPATLQPGLRVPLVFVLHGGGGNAANAEKMTGFTEKARTGSFIVVYPEGSGRLRRGLFTWNAGHCCGYAMENKVDDVAFISSLIDDLSRRYPVDDKRIYVTGMSNGAMLTHRLGIELSHHIAAIAPVVGTVFGDERKPARPVAALMINGVLDQNVPFNGGVGAGRGRDAWDRTPARPSLDQAAFWAKANGCDASPIKDDTATQTVWRYRCSNGRDVGLIALKDNGHAWPGGEKGSARGDKPSESLDATDVIWDFFRRHSLVGY
jgi:polyhydroxybutyrate depolymerase